MEKKGFLYAIGAFSIWGFFPIYWKLISHFSPFELTAYRIIFSFITVYLFLTVRSNLISSFKNLLNLKVFIQHFISTILIGINWFLFIYAVNSANILQASFGYFIGPVFSIIIGLLVLKENINTLKMFSIILMLFAVGLRATDMSEFPWIAILLGLSFSVYGLTRKYITVSSFQSVSYETFLLFIPSCIYILFLESNYQGNFLSSNWIEISLLSFSGILTITPLILFSAGAKRIPLNTLGFIQYLAPTLQFLCAILIYNETMNPNMWLSFIIIWIACIILIYGTRFSRSR